MDSVFNMKRPYDLVAFMKQEDRSGMLDKLKQELLSRKDEIDKTEDRDTGNYLYINNSSHGHEQLNVLEMSPNDI